MGNNVRYEIGEEIARGDFATVYRGKDLRLNRDVAIKQLHHQYLDNPKQTERYWQEAQILARLEHPHVMTIYDVVPDQGWLILELMKGSLKDQLGQRPIHLKDLRLTILFAARALAFFQQQNILHGDVKPSNLLIDRNNVIKLGDFGIARRLQNDEGSAIKGTTRYIAPEVVSDKFGPVGPHSDIYSLGFSAYELLCGDRFESLFPGLNMFGRDQQLAWMMWHSAADRRLPKIKDVLEGVPDNLAAIIEKMTSKDPGRRYQSAEQIIADISSESTIPLGGPSPEELEQAEREAKAAKRKRYLAIGAFSISLLLCLALLFPTGKEEPKKAPALPTQGVVGKVVVDSNKIYLKSEEVVLIKEGDLILLDGVICQLSDLDPNDSLNIEYSDGPNGKKKTIFAQRGDTSHYIGRLAAIDSEQSQLLIAVEGREDRTFVFDGETPVKLNGKSALIRDLQTGDSIDVQFWADEEGAHAVLLDAKRRLETSGIVQRFNAPERQITLERDGTATKMRVANDCVITINGRDNLAGRQTTLADLESGDRVTKLVYDAEVLRIELQRDVSDIVEVWSVDEPGQKITVLVDGEQVPVICKDATITYRARPVDLSFIRKGDELLVAHDSPDNRDVVATTIEVTDLVRDDRLIAIVICQQIYDNIEITPYRYASRDAVLVHEALDTGARVPEKQLGFFKDMRRDELVAAIQEFLAGQQQRAQLVVYYVGQGYVDLADDIPYLAPRDFQLANMRGTGLKLRDLITIFEEFSREKVLILDTCHDVSTVEQQSQPATGNLIRKVTVGDIVSRSVIVMGSCDVDRNTVVDENQLYGEFGKQLAAAFAGAADADDDGMVVAKELYSTLQSKLAAKDQLPIQFQPDMRPPRLTPEAADAVRTLLTELSRLRPSASFDGNFARADQLCGSEPDAKLAHALVKFRSGRTGESLDEFRAIVGSHPNALAAYHAAAYQHLAKKEWAAASSLIARLVGQVALLKRPQDEYLTHLVQFAGTARMFIASLANDESAGQAIDEAAKSLTEDRRAQYDASRNAFSNRAATVPETQRQSVRRFYTFDINQVRDYMLDQLD